MSLSLFFNLCEMHVVFCIPCFLIAVLISLIQIPFSENKLPCRVIGVVGVLIQLYLISCTALAIIAYNSAPNTNVSVCILIAILITLFGTFINAGNNQNSAYNTFIFYCKLSCVIPMYIFLLLVPGLAPTRIQTITNIPFGYTPYAVYAHIRSVLLDIPVLGWIVGFILNIASVVYPIILLSVFVRLLSSLIRKALRYTCKKQ